MSVLKPLHRKLSQVINLTDEEFELLEGFGEEVLNLERGSLLGEENEPSQNAFVVLKGWTCCYKSLPDGARQIVHYPLMGDIIGIRSVVLDVSDHSYSTITDAVVSKISRDRLRRILEGSNRLATAILWMQCREEAIAVERLVDLGRRSAAERLAHFLVEIYYRLKVTEGLEGTIYECPLLQEHLADTLGLSVVHVNRILRELREVELLTFRQGRVEIQDLARLEAFCAFDTHYLQPTSFFK